MGRRYYVVYKKDRQQWVVMLEEGRNLRTFDRKHPAVKYAKGLGKRNTRNVIVNYED